MFPVICAQQRLVLFATKESTQHQGVSQFGPALTELSLPRGLLHNGQDGSCMTSWIITHFYNHVFAYFFIFGLRCLKCLLYLTSM